jgi:hypothetical protein
VSLDGTYAGLKASIADWLHRSDMVAIIPDLIVLAEARIARDLRLRRQISSTTLATVAATQSVALPTDFLEVENLSVGTSIARNLVYMNIEALDVKYPVGSYSGTPVAYTLEGNSLLLGPTPDAAYSISMLYYARLAALSVTPTNWLLTNHPNIYLFGALAEAGDYVRDLQMGTTWDAKYQQGIKHLQDADDRAMFSGSELRVRNL